MKICNLKFEDLSSTWGDA